MQEPRYDDVLAAVAESIRRNPGARTDAFEPERGAEWSVLCMPQGDINLRGLVYSLSGRVRAWFDDPDEGAAPGAAAAWFAKGLAALPAPPLRV